MNTRLYNYNLNTIELRFMKCSWLTAKQAIHRSQPSTPPVPSGSFFLDFITPKANPRKPISKHPQTLEISIFKFKSLGLNLKLRDTLVTST